MDNAAQPRLPRHQEVKSWLRHFADANAPGTAIPPERQLSEQFGVSRTTLRRAVQEMVVEGRLSRVQGSGTFVALPKVAHPLHLSSYSEEMTAQGIVHGTRMLSLEILPASSAVAGRLALLPGAPVTRIERLRLANNEPMALDVSFFSAERFPGLGERAAARGSIYAVLAEDFGTVPDEADETIETAVATPEEASLLGIENGLPMLLLTRHAFLTDDDPIEWARSVFRGDRYKFTARLKRPE